MKRELIPIEFHTPAAAMPPAPADKEACALRSARFQREGSGSLTAPHLKTFSLSKPMKKIFSVSWTLPLCVLACAVSLNAQFPNDPPPGFGPPPGGEFPPPNGGPGFNPG